MASHRTHSAVLLVASLLLLGVGLGGIDFWAPDEPRYGQVAEEVRSMEHGLRGVALLHLGGEPYTQKPPLYYWLAALAGTASDRVTETAARLPSMLAGVGTVLLTWLLGRRLFASPVAALFGAALLLTSFRFAHLARRAQLDVLLVLFETAALLAFWRIDQQLRAGKGIRPSLVVGLHAALGAAALTKGPVGWLPMLVIAVYLAWERRLGSFRALVPPWGLLLSVGPVVAWIAVATSLAPSGFFAEAVVENLVGRVVEAASHVRPFYYYLYQLPADFLPWTLLWPLALLAAARGLAGEERQGWRLLSVWIVVPLLVFSVASGKRGLYLLPVFPALALACGAALDAWMRDREGVPRWLRAVIGVGGVAAIGVGATLARGPDLDWARYPGFTVAGTAAAALWAAGGAGLVLASVLASRRGGLRGAAAAVVATVLVVEAVVFTVVYPGFDEQKSPRGIATLAAGLTAPDETVGIFDDAGLAGVARPQRLARNCEGVSGWWLCIAASPWWLCIAAARSAAQPTVERLAAPTSGSWRGGRSWRARGRRLAGGRQCLRRLRRAAGRGAPNGSHRSRRHSGA